MDDLDENPDWKLIRPNKTYEEIKRKFYQNERKRKYQETKKQWQEHDAQKVGVGTASPARKRIARDSNDPSTEASNKKKLADIIDLGKRLTG